MAIICITEHGHAYLCVCTGYYKALASAAIAVPSAMTTTTTSLEDVHSIDAQLELVDEM